MAFQMQRMTQLEFIAFLQEGTLRGIALGTPRRQVIEVFGEPQDTSVNRKRPFDKYSNIQVFYDEDCQLCGVAIYFDRDMDDIKSIPPPLPPPIKNESIVEDYLRSMGFTFKIVTILTFETQITWEIPSGVTIIFDRQKMRLDTMQLFSK